MSQELIKQEILSKLDVKFCLAKLTEEFMEAGEVCMKMHNKKADKAPPIKALIEELGDVLVRIEILALKLNIVDEVAQRVESKFTKIAEYLKTYSQA